MRRAAAAAVLALALMLAPGIAGAQPVDVGFDAFSPSQLDVLPGETVTWTNGSPRVHTVTSDSGLFDTGELVPGAVFTRGFDTPGAYTYHCTIHAGMVGEVDVRRVILGPLPTAVVPAGERVAISGRAADVTRPVSIQRRRGGAFETVASAMPAPDGSWRAVVTAEASTEYRAASAADVSQTRRLLVSVRRVRLRATRRGVTVTVTPVVPYAPIMLQADLHERFGWWPVARAKLDYLSQATFRVRRPARVRAVLVAKDGWTPLATSPVLTLGNAKPTHMGGMHMHAVAAPVSRARG